MGERGMGRIFRKRRRIGTVLVEYGNWQIEYWHHGRAHKESAESLDRNVARRLLKKRLSECVTGKLIGPASERTTVDELLEDLAVEYRVRGRASIKTLAHRTKALRVMLEGIRAVDVTTARINRLVAAWQEGEKAPATINRYLSTLRRAFVLGARSTPPKVALIPQFPKLPEHNVRRGWVDRTAIVSVLGYLETADAVLHDFVTWLYWTGMRVGSARQVEWTSIDRETWSLVLPAEHEKSRKARALPLLPVLQEVLKRRDQARIAYAQRTGLVVPWVFWRMYSGAPCQIIDYRKAWASACKAAGCHGRLPHDLRRTAVRNMRRAGIDRRTAMAISGHRTESVFERYNVDHDLELRDAMGRLGTYVESLPVEGTTVPMGREWAGSSVGSTAEGGPREAAKPAPNRRATGG